MHITQAIIQLRWQVKRKQNLSPQEINNGSCEEFADLISDIISDAFSIWGDSVCPILWSSQVFNLPDWFSHFTNGHCFIMFNNKFYDSECPQGCNYPDKLPFYQREIKEYF